MSLDNETVVDETNLETNEDEASTQVTSEQLESEDNPGIAAEGNDTEQVGETVDDFNLSDVLTGKTEPEEDKPNKMPRSTRRALRNNKRLEKELEQSNKRFEALQRSQAPVVNAQVPTRDYDNDETDEQFNFRTIQAAINHNQNTTNAGTQHTDNINRAGEAIKAQEKVIELYSTEVNTLNLPNYDEAESRVLDMFPEGSLTHMSNIDPSATAKIIYHLDHNPDKLEKFAQLAKNNAAGFNYEFGRLASDINNLESRARKKHKAISKAPGDKALAGSSSASTSLEAKKQKAADAGDTALYRKLKYGK